MKNHQSVFSSPDFEIDERLYFSDITISQYPIFEEYQQLIKEKRYNEALEIIKNINYYGAWLFNLLEDRDHEIYECLNGLDKPLFCLYQKEEPDIRSSDVHCRDKDGTDYDGLIWIEYGE